MAKRIPVPQDLEHLIEKRERDGDRRKTKSQDAPESTPAERRKQNDRRRRRKSSS
jgi:hypothetical protein